jgi:hypothetical protein
MALVTPSRAAMSPNGAVLPLCAACSSQRAACCASTCGESVSARPGASSGRQRRQGRNPARSAPAALAKKRQLRRSGVRTRQVGRQ